MDLCSFISHAFGVAHNQNLKMKERVDTADLIILGAGTVRLIRQRVSSALGNKLSGLFAEAEKK